MNDNTNPKILEKIRELQDDRLHGANWLASQALSIMGLAIQESKTTTIAEFMNDLSKVATSITKARPSMASISN